MAGIEAQSVNQEFMTVFSRGSEKEPVAERLNAFGTKTIYPQAALGLLSFLLGEPFQSMAFLATAGGTAVGIEGIHQIYRRLPDNRKEAIRRLTAKRK